MFVCFFGHNLHQEVIFVFTFLKERGFPEYLQWVFNAKEMEAYKSQVELGGSKDSLFCRPAVSLTGKNVPCSELGWSTRVVTIYRSTGAILAWICFYLNVCQMLCSGRRNDDLESERKGENCRRKRPEPFFILFMYFLAVLIRKVSIKCFRGRT